jgi:hypothetical protein
MSKGKVLGKIQVTTLAVLASTEKTLGLERERLCLWELYEGNLEVGLLTWDPEGYAK